MLKLWQTPLKARFTSFYLCINFFEFFLSDDKSLEIKPNIVAQALKIGQDDQAAIQEKLSRSRFEKFIHFAVTKF